MSGIVECRTYRLRPGTVKPFLDLYQRKGFPVQSKHLGDPVGYYYTEIGPLNQIVHMWAYASFEEGIKGSVETGKLADLVVLGSDPTQVDPLSIKDIEVQQTIVGGETVYGG